MAIERINEKPPVEWKPGSPQDPKRRTPGPAAERTDDVKFSEQSQEAVRIRKLATAAPEIRQDRVEQLRREIAKGTFQVSGEKIADAIVQEHQIDLTAF